ncbi:RHS repeat-associated core domain-containing protein [Pseudodesulfovibrio thermohalotolerans]|uniref:RHS repeat domain-containing protein n=1 Tax=Pseudodesulfovibrio thermohalotolerans TaxID=2880651 RepID=UPI002442BCFB|nr:RHS repeat-associated core domain-containing protein [Pseudodesulfovibrio thermohalotolerans]WFS61831.1 RHS repeat-associated core domain-containing protein [Pseudodesulfovibrio thermohalotolerans]
MSVFDMRLKHDRNGRIVEKTEIVAGRPVVWKYAYDKAGRLFEAHLDNRLICQCYYDRDGRRQRDCFPATVGSSYRDYRYNLDNRLMSAGNNGFTHDENGFRSIWSNGGTYHLYEYAPDYRLLKMEEENQNRVYTFRHDEQGRRAAKYFNGQLVEAYQWLDFIRLGAFHDGRMGYEFGYGDDERLPSAMRREDGAVFTLRYDQVGSLRVVADADGNVIKEVLYDPFGGIIADTNPGLRVPLGFAGGLHDRDLGFVRFGWRDYDPFTGRWTAPDPIGDRGGDPDWYGYCLDDPVNANDPTGLLPFLLPFAAGMAGATAISATGSYLSAKAADWFGKKTDKDYGKDKPTATEGVHDAMGKVIGINSGIVGAAGAAKAAPAAAAAAMQHPDKLAAGSKAAADFASGYFDESPPPASWPGYLGGLAGKGSNEYKRRKKK